MLTNYHQHVQNPENYYCSISDVILYQLLQKDRDHHKKLKSFYIINNIK